MTSSFFRLTVFLFAALSNSIITIHGILVVLYRTLRIDLIIFLRYTKPPTYSFNSFTLSTLDGILLTVSTVNSLH